MAISVHTVIVKWSDQTIVPDNDVSNSSGSPTIQAYIAAEAADGYLPVSSLRDGMILVTASVSDVNAA